MSYAYDLAPVAAEAAASERVAFIRRTYAHLAVAILAFVGLETVLLKVVPQEILIGFITKPFAPLIMLAGFIGVAWLGDSWARSNVSRGLQYAGLGLYVVAEAIIFWPLLHIAIHHGYQDVVPKAAVMTLAVFGGLTVGVLFTGKDFSFLRTALTIGSVLAFGAIIVGMWMGGGLGLWFSFAMVALACGFILYSTSNVLHHYHTDQHVAASLALFASVAMLFFYVLRIFMSQSRD